MRKPTKFAPMLKIERLTLNGTADPDILYTIVTRPELASASLLPIVRSFAALEDQYCQDISLAGRIKATFGNYLKEDQNK